MTSLYFSPLEDSIVELDRVVFGGLTPRSVWESKHRIRVITARIDDVIAGYIVFYQYADDVIHIWKTGVLPSFRRRGILSSMVEEVISLSRELRMSVSIGTNADRFPAMKTFLDSHACVPYPERVGKDGYTYYIWKF